VAEQINPDALPEDLTDLTPEQLTDAQDRARTEAEDLSSQENLDAAGLERLEYLVGTTDQPGYLDRIAEQQTAIEDAEAQMAERREAAQARLNPSEEDSADAPEGDEEAADDEGDEPAEEQPADQSADDGDAEAPAEGAPQAVAASATRGRAPQPRRQPRNPRPARKAKAMHTIVAAAEVPGFAGGQAIPDMAETAKAFIARAKAFPSGRAAPNQYHKLMVASIERDFSQTPDGLHQDNRDFADDYELALAASRENRLAGGSLIQARAKLPLVAAGGWCAPSQTIYDLTQDESLAGIVDLPTIGVTRGGINFTQGPDFSDIYTSAGFSQTEAEAIAGTTKNCVEIDCPDFDEVRLDAVGICVKAPLLTNAAYPELVRRWISGTETANEHKIAGRLLTSMATALGSAVVPTLTGTPFAWGLLSTIELAISGQRQTRRLSLTETFEVVLPFWVLPAVRADLANRMGIGADSVSDAQVRQHFADRGASVQFVYNWQALSGEKPTNYPTTVQVMIYPAGKFVRGNAAVINLSTVYDTADLQTNVYTAAFVEDGVLLANMKHGGALYTVPVNINGMLGAAQLDDNLFGAQAESAGA
jgi:hypothetical protein